jgi:hypothetical protein
MAGALHRINEGIAQRDRYASARTASAEVAGIGLGLGREGRPDGLKCNHRDEGTR